MERIINVLGKKYRLSSNIELTAEQMNNVIKRIEAAGGDLKKLQTGSGRCVIESGYYYNNQMGCKIRDSCTNEFLTGWFECYRSTQVLWELIQAGKCGACPSPPLPCTPTWTCEQPLNGYESDGCGNRRLNAACNPTCTPSWTCEQPLNGYESDGCGNRRVNTICNPTGGCIPNWQCEKPLNGYESDGCGNRRTNTRCKPTAPPSAPGAGTIIGIGLIGTGLLGVVVIASRKKRR